MTSERRLDGAERAELLAIATDAIASALARGRIDVLDERKVADPRLLQPGAAFVTLLRGDDLLGCVGSLHATEPLAQAVHRAALQAAFADPRLPAVTVDDYEVMTVKVSVLSQLEPLAVASFGELASTIRSSIDGIVIDAPRHRATLLPSVWEQCPTVNDFLSALWQKAGLAPGVWVSGLRVERYTTEEFASFGPRRLVAASSSEG